MSAPAVSFRLPDPELRPLLSAYYFVDVPEDFGVVEDKLHPEWGNIRFSLTSTWEYGPMGGEYEVSPKVTLIGPTSRTVRVRGTPGQLLGIGVLPLGWAQLIGLPAADFVDRMNPLEAAFGEAAAPFVEAVLGAPDRDAQVMAVDAFLLARMRAAPPPAPAVARAHAALLDPAVGTAEEFARALGVSERHAARLCLSMFGFPPKLLLRRQRFLRTLAALAARPDVPWATLLDQWYYDESHFIRDFQRFMATTPRRYFADARPVLSRAGVAREKALGATYQGLHAKAK